MAKSRFEYVRNFEESDFCMLNCWIVCRVDGKNFHKLSDKHKFVKPNDDKSLNLMNVAACHVMSQFPDIVLAYGQSDEYSFVFKKNTKAYNRRRSYVQNSKFLAEDPEDQKSKLSSIIVSFFTSAFVFYWNEHFPETKLLYPPSFDSRIILYPSYQNLRDYLSWRQADCHINNLHNYCYWKLIQNGMTPSEANTHLKGTDSKDKNELLFSRFQINYNTLPSMHRKGSVVKRMKERRSIVAEKKSPSADNNLIVEHVDIIGDQFWKDNPHIVMDD